MATNKFNHISVKELSRQQIDELNIEIEELLPQLDAWLGRQTLYKAGGVQFDGLRAISIVDRSRKAHFLLTIPGLPLIVAPVLDSLLIFSERGLK